MFKISKLILVAALIATPVAVLAQAAGAGAGVGGSAAPGGGAGGVGPSGVGTGGIGTTMPASPGGGANPAPGGITLVPGTVVTPGVGGSAATGTVPLPGTVGSPGIGNLNPNSGATSNPGVAANNGSLYPPAYYPQTPLPGTSQSTLPFGATATNPNASSLSPSIANCPPGVAPVNGVC